MRRVLEKGGMERSVVARSMTLPSSDRRFPFDVIVVVVFRSPRGRRVDEAGVKAASLRLTLRGKSRRTLEMVQIGLGQDGSRGNLGRRRGGEDV